MVLVWVRAARAHGLRYRVEGDVFVVRPRLSVVPVRLVARSGDIVTLHYEPGFWYQFYAVWVVSNGRESIKWREFDIANLRGLKKMEKAAAEVGVEVDVIRL